MCFILQGTKSCIMQSHQEVQQQKFGQIEQWQQSGLTQRAFCLQNSISYHVFHYWYKRYRDARPETDKRASSFIKLKVSPADMYAHAELILPDGKRLLFHHPVSSDYLKAIIS
jgi:hypothetical protein